MSYEIEQIKSRISLSSLISRRVLLKRKTHGEYIGLCPFHPEKTPSFHVNDNKGSYHCFGCGAHGDIFSYKMQDESMTFREVLVELAKEAGVELTTITPKKKEEQSLQDKLTEIYKVTADYYIDNLNSKEGLVATDYLHSRGINPEIWAKYKLGYATSSHHELENILSKQFSSSDIAASKILFDGKYGRYNPFKERLIFPITNSEGKIIAFGGRILNEGMPKYLNSPETPIFIKNRTLYGLNIAKPYVVKEKKIIVVEGYLDVLSLANVGIFNAVAPLGTSISTTHLEALWRLVDCPTLCLDVDIAGKKATLRIAHEAMRELQTKKTLEFAYLTGGKDPDEVITKHGKSYFQQILNNCLPISEFMFESELNAYPLNTPEQKADLKSRLEELANTIGDKKLAKSYRSYFYDQYYKLLGVKFNLKNNHQTKNLPKFNISKSALEEEHYLLIVLALIKKYPALVGYDEIIDDLQRIEIKSKNLDKARGFILDLSWHPDQQLERVGEELDKYFNKQMKLELDESVLKQFEGQGLEEIKLGVTKILKIYQLKELQQQVNLALSKLTINQHNENYEKLKFLKAQEEILKQQLDLYN